MKPPNHRLFDDLYKDCPPRPSLIAQRAAEQVKQQASTAPSTQPIIHNHVTFPTELVGGARPAADVAPPLATGVTTASNPRRLTDESLLSLDGRKGPEMELVAFCERYKISSTLRERLVKNGYDAPELLPDTCIKDLKEAGFLGGELMRLRNAVSAWADQDNVGGT